MNKGIRNCKLNFSREQINIHFHHIDYNNDKQHGLRKKQKKVQILFSIWLAFKM